jgi:Zn-dependent membrane protease YugP
VEIDASSRALKILKSGFMSPGEVKGARKVLNAAAMTYIAAALTAILHLIRLLILSGILGEDR